MERAPSKCILCNSSSRTILIRLEDWTIYKCADCGLGFLDPRPDRNELQDLYRNDYFSSHYDEGLKIDSPEMKRRISQEDHRVKFFRGLKRHGKVLDIGCGMGYFLYACRAYGYEVDGLDVSGDSASYVRNELKIPVTTGQIEEIDLEDNSMDIITMWHTLEHTPDPRKHLKKAWNWLKSDGLLIVDVPNYKGTDAQKMWGGWSGWDLPYHLYHFTPNTLINILSQHGFRTIRTKDYHSQYIKKKLKKIPVVNFFARLIAKCYSGQSVAVVAKRNLTSQLLSADADSS